MALQKSPFDLLRNPDTKVEGIGVLILFVFIIFHGAQSIGSALGRAWAPRTDIFATVLYKGEERAIIRKYGDTYVTLPYEDDNLKKTKVKLLSKDIISGLSMDSKRLNLD